MNDEARKDLEEALYLIAHLSSLTVMSREATQHNLALIKASIKSALARHTEG